MGNILGKLRKSTSPEPQNLLSSKVILHLDVDCYEVQVWLRKFHPHLLEKEDEPMIVINQDNVIVSVNYPAKKLGIKRAKEERRGLQRLKYLFPNLVVISGGTRGGMTDNLFLMKESDRIQGVLLSYKELIVYKSSGDEFSIDASRQLLGRSEAAATDMFPDYESQQAKVVMIGEEHVLLDTRDDWTLQHAKLLHLEEVSLLLQGGALALELMTRIKEETGYDVSIGVGVNMLQAKIACGLHRPKGITVLTRHGFHRVSPQVNFRKLPGYGADLGQELEDVMGLNAGLVKTTREGFISLADIQSLGPEGLTHFWNRVTTNDFKTEELEKKSFGICYEEVVERLGFKGINQKMSFKGIRSRQDSQSHIDGFARVFIAKLNYCFQKHGKLLTCLHFRVEGAGGEVISLEQTFPQIPKTEELCAIFEQLISQQMTSQRAARWKHAPLHSIKLRGLLTRT